MTCIAVIIQQQEVSYPSNSHNIAAACTGVLRGLYGATIKITRIEQLVQRHY